MAARSLRDPTRKSIEISQLTGKLFQERRSEMNDPFRTRRINRRIKVKFGEMRTSIGKEEGVLVIGEMDKSITKLKKGRKYI